MLSKVIMKASGACNLSCSYCYYMTGRSRERQQNMSIDVMARVLSDIAEYASDVGVLSPLQVYWHGGEPLLQPFNFWTAADDIQKSLTSRYGVSWDNSITTNGTLLNAQLCEFFGARAWSVAVSIDGPSSLHDEERTFHSGRGSWTEAVNGFHCLRKAGIEPMVLSVIRADPGNGTRLFEFMSDLGVKRADLLLPLYNWTDRSRAEATTRGLLTELLDFFGRWCVARAPFYVRIFDVVTSKARGDLASLCHHEDLCHEVVTVEPDGRYHVCDDLGAVHEQPTDLYAIAGTESFQRFADVADLVSKVVATRGYYDKHEACTTCDVYAICQGGCPANRWDGHTFKNVSVHCGIYKGLYSLIRDVIREHDLASW